MTVVLPAFGVAFAAFGVWLAVRIINRRERWAKWTAVGLVVTISAGYPLSVGPITYLDSHDLLSNEAMKSVEYFYWPLNWTVENGPKPIRETLWSYSRLWMSDDDPMRQMQPGDVW